MHVLWRILALGAAIAAACSAADPATQRAPVAPPVTITIIGTSDLHGHLEALPLLAGYVRHLRAVGPTLLIDAGDMFQGTLESNLGEGAGVIDAYNAMGYAAAAIGNHEFDFGPVGDKPIPDDPSDDPRGALKARVAQAQFPMLSANIVDARTRARPNWPNLSPSLLRTVAGIEVGIVGVTTMSTPESTASANFAGLDMVPLAQTIEAEARALRRRGARVVVVAAHAGGACESFADPEDLTSCKPSAEIFDVARALAPGLVDVIVAGHTHDGLAHRVNGVVIVQAYSRGVAFARADITVGPGGVTAKPYPPQFLCPKPGLSCESANYEGAVVAPDVAIAAIVAEPTRRAAAERKRMLGPVLPAPIPRAYGVESPLGNLFADLMRQARPKADVSLTNGGGLRADLPAGPLQYGSLYEAMPFDNRFAHVNLTGRQLRRLIVANLQGDRGIFSVSGMLVDARCSHGQLNVMLTRPGGAIISDDTPIALATSDFLASGGDGMLATLKLELGAIVMEETTTIRDEMAAVLSRVGGELRVSPDVYDPRAPRMRYPGIRPVTCR